MSLTHVQSLAPVGNVAASLAQAITPAIGDGIFVYFSCGDTTDTFTISDTAGNTWNVIRAQATLGGNRIGTWWANSKGNTSTTITVTVTPNNAFLTLIIDQWRGQAASPVDNKNEGSGNSTNPSITLTPVANNCGLWVACQDSITAVGTGHAYNKGGDDTQQDWSEWFILTGGAGVSQTCDFVGTTGAWSVVATSIAPSVVSSVPWYKLPTVGPSYTI